MNLLPEKWDEPEASVQAIFRVAGQFLAKNLFLIQQANNDEWDEEGKNR